MTTNPNGSWVYSYKNITVFLLAVLGSAVLVGLGIYAFHATIDQVTSDQKCYGSLCNNPALSNEIIGADYSHQYVILTLNNGKQITTDCLTKAYDLTQNATSWWCGTGAVHTIQYERNP